MFEVNPASRHWPPAAAGSMPVVATSRHQLILDANGGRQPSVAARGSRQAVGQGGVGRSAWQRKGVWRLLLGAGADNMTKDKKHTPKPPPR